MRHAIFAIAIVGAVMLGLLLALSYLQPIHLESWTRVVVQHEVQKRVEDKINILNRFRIVRAAQRVVGQNNQAILETKEALASALFSKVVDTVEKMLDPNCPCRALARNLQLKFLQGKLGILQQANERLTALIELKYFEVTEALLREIRIFCAANTLVFICLGIVTWTRKKATLQLLAPTVVLLGAGILVSYTYLFAQNWLQTILFGEYVGFWYFPYLFITVSCMADIVFNRARICTIIVNTVFSALGSAVSAIPC